MFAQIAKRYDLLNTCLTFGLNRYWNYQLAKHLLEQNPKDILDLCAGTGAISHQILSQSADFPPEKITLLDFCPEMLEMAKGHLNGLDVHTDLEFVTADAQHLPFNSQSFCAITLSFGIRNIQQPEKTLEEAFRVLRPKGFLYIMELSRPQNALLAKFHHLYLKTVVPFMARLLSPDPKAYNYLAQSVKEFMPAQELQNLIENQGFKLWTLHPFFPGAATLFIAQKP